MPLRMYLLSGNDRLRPLQTLLCHYCVIVVLNSLPFYIEFLWLYHFMTSTRTKYAHMRYICWITKTFKLRASWSLSASEDDKWLDVKKMERMYNSRTASTYNHNMTSQLSTGHLDAAQCASLIPLILIPGILACLRFYWAHGVLINL